MDGIEALALANRDYVEELYRRFVEDPSAVDGSWRAFFQRLDGVTNGRPAPAAALRSESAQAGAAPVLGVYDLVHSYRELGHLMAHLNPLAPEPEPHPLLDPSEFGFADADMSRVVESGSFLGCEAVQLRDLIARLQETYCGTIAVEYLHMQDKEQRRWLQERMEPACNDPRLGTDDRLTVFQQMVFAEGFEQFLQKRYPTAKRFSLEGGESLIPLLDVLIEDGAMLGVEEMVMGMPHRGRLNVLVNVLRKPYEMVLSEFEGSFLGKEAEGDGDVKYHLGYSRDHVTRRGARVHLSLGPNPSHLEVIDPVIEGIVRAKQNHLGDRERSRVVPVLMHGDAAFTGQGIVAETLWLSELESYRTGGTIHIIINNQIGFTTVPEDFRFTPYPSDVAKIIQAPVFHVNGDDPEAAVQAARLAIAFRQIFKKDVIIDLVCYRKHGHNELDDPRFTQPTMYKTIEAHPSPREQYEQRLIHEDVLRAEDAEARWKEFQDLLGDAQEYARDFMPRQQVFAFGGLWKGLSWAGEDTSAHTAVSREALDEVAAAFVRVPAGFEPYPKLMKLMQERVAMVKEGKPMDWGCAEALAFGTLVLEGTSVRLTGQDTARGTFSHRHAVWRDIETGARHVPLDAMRTHQGRFLVTDSMLSENACLGFEFGFSLADPHKLVVWEAQFGDFANGAQVIIDQFIATSESKWQRMSGLVMLLPHGYEGQGPEHSSARLERFLQLCAEDNLQVVNLTTPAQLFHALRRQIHRTFRKPLVVMSPKSLLRHKLAVSSVDELTTGTLQLVLDDPDLATDAVRAAVTRLLFCSGKVAYDLLPARPDQGADHVAVIRLEQIYPFPEAELRAVIARYPNVREACWVQEEPQNMGAWEFVARRLPHVLPVNLPFVYVGREAAASPATGSFKIHQTEQRQVVDAALAR